MAQKGLTSAVGVLCGVHTGHEDEIWSKGFIQFLMRFPKGGEALDRSSLEPFALEPSGGEECLPQYTHAWWEGTTPLKTLVDCLISFEKDRWQMANPYRGKNDHPERLSLQEAKLFLTRIRHQVRKVCQMRIDDLVECREALEGDRLEPPGSISYAGHRSLDVLDAKQYLTEKEAEVRGRVQACFHELESVTRALSKNRPGFVTIPPSAEALLAEARASAAKSVPQLDTEKRRYRLEEPVTNGVSQREIFEIGRAKRLLPGKWVTNRYTPSLLYMLGDPADVE